MKSKVEQAIINSRLNPWEKPIKTSCPLMCWDVTSMVRGEHLIKKVFRGHDSEVKKK